MNNVWHSGVINFECVSPNEGNGENNVEHMWEQVKRAMVKSAREMWGQVRVGRGNPKNLWWNDQVIAPDKGKEAAWKEVSRCLEVCEEEKRKVKSVYIKARRRFKSLERRGIKI